MMKKKFLASVVVAGLFAGAATTAQAVSVNDEDWGQVLLGPMYITGANGGSNYVRVANTSLTDAVKVKMVLRSRIHSQECRDIIMYLTPGDVGAVTIGASATSATAANIKSTDDSILQGLNGATPVFASTTPYDFDTVDGANFPATGGLSDDCSQGHIEVIGVYRIPAGTYTAFNGDTVTVRNRMSKGDLYKLFGSPEDQTVGGGRPYLNGQATNGSGRTASGVAVNTTGVPSAALGQIAFSAPTDYNNTNTYIRLIGQNDLILRNGDQILVPMVPLIGDATSPLIANESFDATVRAETAIGQGWGILARDNLQDIDNALAVNSANAIYDNIPGSKSTNLLVTFPTRYRYRTGSTYAAPFFTNGAVQYNVTSFDLQENSVQASGCFQSPCAAATSRFITEESNYIGGSFFSTQLNATEGWFNMNLLGVSRTVNLTTSAAGATTQVTGRTYVPTLVYSHRVVNGQSVVHKVSTRADR